MFSQRDLDLTQEPMDIGDLEDILMLQRGMIDTILNSIHCSHPVNACVIQDNETVYCQRCEEQLTPDQVVRRMPGDNRVR
jgi:hypothetical protein